jgi:hypothetical protein
MLMRVGASGVVAVAAAVADSIGVSEGAGVAAMALGLAASGAVVSVRFEHPERARTHARAMAARVARRRAAGESL